MHFLPKVGSDACLLLTASYDSQNNIASIDQQFSIDEIEEAAKTRIIMCRFNNFPASNMCTYGLLSCLHNPDVPDGVNRLRFITSIFNVTGITSLNIEETEIGSGIWRASLS